MKAKEIRELSDEELADRSGRVAAGLAEQGLRPRSRVAILAGNSVDYAAYENMKRLETGGAYAGHGQRLVPGIRGNPDSFKVRRAKVGGYRDYFDDEQAAAIDALMAERQGPLFGYLPLSEATGEVPAPAADDGQGPSETG